MDYKKQEGPARSTSDRRKLAGQRKWDTRVFKSIHIPCYLTKPAGLTTGPALAFLVLPASAAGPAVCTQLCLWVAVFALGILGVSFYKGTGSDK